MLLLRKSPLFSLFAKPSLPLISLQAHRHHHHFCSFPCNPNSSLERPPVSQRRRGFCCLAAPRESPPAARAAPRPVSAKMARKARRESPEGVLKQKLDMCSKHGHVAEALRFYDEARRNGIPMSQYHYNAVLYLCSCGDGEVERGFEIFSQMVSDRVEPNEATFTSVARLAAAAEDPERAFALVKQMRSCGIPPKLRSYGPALFGFCKKGEAERAYEVDAHMLECGVNAEELELAALLKLSAESKKGEKAYEMMHRLRVSVRQVSEQTAEIVEEWFGSEEAARVGKESWDVRKVRDSVARGGGGWHGQGWLGTGRWKVVRTRMDENGVCQCCNKKLVCIDINPKETENFTTLLASLACKKEVRADFVRFQEWLKRHGPFDAVVDGANICLINQHSFNFFQLKCVVDQLRQISPSKKMPLVILHQSRAKNGPAQEPKNKLLLESWKKSGVLYTSPPGSNDDWYWLYAAVSFNCLLVTNDEMRDHLFQLLGSSFFPRWKEKHQVRMSVSRKGQKLHMPPPYSNVIQESEDGCWHMPTVTGDDLDAPRQWLCATRTRNTKL